MCVSQMVLALITAFKFEFTDFILLSVLVFLSVTPGSDQTCTICIMTLKNDVRHDEYGMSVMGLQLAKWLCVYSGEIKVSHVSPHSIAV